MFAPKTVVGAGHKLGYLAKTTIELTKGAAIKATGDDAVTEGHLVWGNVGKNRLGTPYTKFSYSLRYDGTGIDNVGSIIAFGVEEGLIVKAGSFY